MELSLYINIYFLSIAGTLFKEADISNRLIQGSRALIAGGLSLGLLYKLIDLVYNLLNTYKFRGGVL